MLDLQTQRIQVQSTELLSEISNKERLFELCSEATKEGKMWTGNDNDLLINLQYFDMPILLQLFVEISDFFLGDISDSDIVRISFLGIIITLQI